jgi:hypothetical protein
MNSAGCCNFAASFGSLGTQCQQTVASNNESICATLLSTLQSYGICQ